MHSPAKSPAAPGLSLRMSSLRLSSRAPSNSPSLAPPSIKWALLTASVIAVVLCLPPTAVFAHPFHVTIAEAEWNEESKSLEVSLRVNPLDVERLLRQRWKRSVELTEGDKKAEQELHQYLEERLSIVVNGKRLKPKWVGMEVEVSRAWLYFEYPLAAAPGELAVEHRVFHELEKDQVNTLLLKVGDHKLTRHFTRHKAKHQIELPAAK